MYYSSFGVLAIILHLIINYDLLLKDEYHDLLPANSYYRRYLISLLLFYFADVIWGFLYEKKWVLAAYGDTSLFFLSMVVTVLFWTRFVMNYLNDHSLFRTVLTIAGWGIFIYEVVCLFINLFHPVLFRFYEDGRYEPLPGRYITLGLQMILFLVASVYSLLVSIRSDGKTRFHYRTIGISGVAMTIFIVLQATDPLLPYYSVGCMMGTALLHTFVLEDEKRDRRKVLEELLEREKQHRIELETAKRIAYTDSLTGVKSKHAYFEMENAMDRRIVEEGLSEFGVVAFDLNGLKQINDTFGHEEGDRFIKAACRMICGIFQHSPVFRTGGDEFVAVLEGEDFKNRKALLEHFDKEIEENAKKGEMVIASGCEIYTEGQDNCYQTVYERADRKMYSRKAHLKEITKKYT